MAQELTGRDLDDAVAVRVMGLVPGTDFGAWTEHDWKLDEDGDVDTSDLGDDRHNGPMCSRCGYWYCEDCQRGPTKPCAVSPRRFSVDITAAWSGLEAMRAKGFRPGMYENLDGNWTVNFSNKSVIGIATASTAQEAICRAALAARQAEGRSDEK